MVRVNPSQPLVHEELLEGESVTVPSGKFWEVSINGHGNFNWFIDTGKGQFNINRGNTSSDDTMEGALTLTNVILTEGTTFSLADDGSTRKVVVSGFEYDINGEIENTPVCESYDSGGFTVPSGETWRVAIYMHANINHFINGNNVNHGSMYGIEKFERMVLTGGDTLESSHSDNGGFITGFKL